MKEKYRTCTRTMNYPILLPLIEFWISFEKGCPKIENPTWLPQHISLSTYLYSFPIEVLKI